MESSKISWYLMPDDKLWPSLADSLAYVGSLAIGVVSGTSSVVVRLSEEYLLGGSLYWDGDGISPE